MLLVLRLKIVGKFKGTQKFSKCSPAPPSTDGAEEVGKSGIWKNPRSIDSFVLCVCVYGCSVESDSFRPHGLQPTRLLCPWDFSRQEYWRRLPFPPSEDLPHPGIEPVFPTSLVSPTLASRFFTTAQPGKPCPNYSFPLSRTAYK